MVKVLSVGVWEGGIFIGAVLFSRGANRHIGHPFNLGQNEIAELVRVALRSHVAPVSQIVSIAVRLLRKQSPGLRLLVSYADPAQGHCGGIYQAMGWEYIGTSQPQAALILNGWPLHKRTGSGRGRLVNANYGEKSCKYKYVLRLDKSVTIEGKPYPKCVRSVDGDTSAIHAEKGGSIPTRTLPAEATRESAAVGVA